MTVAALRPNRLAIQLSENRPLVGLMMYAPTARWVEVVGHAGLDFIHFDAEHDGLSASELYPLVIAAENVGLSTIIRVPHHRPETVLAYAETGVNAVLAPHIKDADTARRLVAAVSFPPAGVRGNGLGRAANYGIGVSASEYFRSESQRTLVGALLEDREAYERFDEIAAVEGIDMFMLGLDDLAGSMGVPGQPGHPEVLALAESARTRLIADGRVFGMGAGNGRQASAEIAAGARIVLTGALGLMARATEEFVAGAKTPA